MSAADNFFSVLGANLEIVNRVNFSNTPFFWQAGDDDQVYTFAGGERVRLGITWEHLTKELSDFSQATGVNVYGFNSGGIKLAAAVDPSEVDLYARILNQDSYLEHWTAVVYRGRSFVIPVSWDRFHATYFGEANVEANG